MCTRSQSTHVRGTSLLQLYSDINLDSFYNKDGESRSGCVGIKEIRGLMEKIVGTMKRTMGYNPL